MLKTKRTPEFDYLMHERVDILMDQGYCGFAINKISGDKHFGEYLVEATNHQGIILTTKGETKEDACKKMIDLIDVTVDDF